MLLMSLGRKCVDLGGSMLLLVVVMLKVLGFIDGRKMVILVLLVLVILKSLVGLDL